jgi:hypothetical protein
LTTAGPGRGKKEKTGGVITTPPVSDAATRAELGQERGKIGKATGTRGHLRGKPKGVGSSGGAIVAPPDGRAPTIAELGIDKKRLQRAERLAAMSDDERDAWNLNLKLLHRIISRARA